MLCVGGSDKSLGEIYLLTLIPDIVMFNLWFQVSYKRFVWKECCAMSLGATCNYVHHYYTSYFACGS